MLQYIEDLKDEYENTDNEAQKNEIICKLRAEKGSSKRIISEYMSRKRLGIDCDDICEHEDEIIERINEILNNLN